MEKHLAITGISAMQAWDEGAGAYARPSRFRSPAAFAATSSELGRFTTLPQGCAEPVEILVGSDANRPKTRKWWGRLCRGQLPAGSLAEVGNGRLLTTPEYFFMRVAPRLSLVRAVLLGMELCGYYSTLMSVPYREYCEAARVKGVPVPSGRLWPPSSWDMSIDHQKGLMDKGFVARSPLTDSKALSSYLNRALSENSHSRALSAARLVRGDSHSPMESRLYARYCLPRRHGGLNLMPVELNGAITLPESLARATGVENYYVDLLWRGAGIGIEYQGGFAHAGMGAEQRDRLKRNILESTGIRILSIDKRQYDNEDLLELYGREIAKKLGIGERKLEPRGRERLARFALVDELRSWDFDLYRPN